MNKVKIFRILCNLSVGCIIMGAMFKIMHWPLAIQLSVFGAIALTISSALYFYFKPEKSFLDRIALVAVPFWSIYMIIRKMDFPYRYEIGSGLLAGILIYTIYVIIKMNKEDKSSSAPSINWERILFAAGMGTIIIGVILKYNYMPYGRYFLIVGIIISIASYLFGFFSNNEELDSDNE